MAKHKYIETPEEWRDIKGYEGLYQVSNLGRVKSLPKEWVIGKGGIRKHNGKTLKGSVTDKGYSRVLLYKNGTRKEYSVHQLVAMAFLGHTPCGYVLVVDHIDDNPKNNRVDNLQIVTHRFNTYKTQGKYSSKYKGVYWSSKSNKWRAGIRINGKQKHLGLFTCELAAHHAYQKAVKNLIDCN